MLLAEVNNGWFLGSTIISAVVGVGALAVAVVALNKKSQVRLDQPVSIEMVDKLVTKDDFQKHVATNSGDHDKIFAKIGGVERGGAASLDKHVSGIYEELQEQGKDIAGLKKETELQNQSLLSMQGDIKLILGRLPRNSHER